MSNERIDLSQFESEEEWDLTGFDWLAKQADSDYVANAVRQVPDLIAELKRCYAMLDAIAYEVASCSECGGHREKEGLFHYCQNYCRCEDFDTSE